ncbi:MAG: hypothetical protein ABIP88_00405 [Candidatus Binatia bacterium]
MEIIDPVVAPVVLLLGIHVMHPLEAAAAEVVHLDERVLLLEGLFERPDHLLDDQRGVKSELAFLLGTVDENFLALDGFEQRDIFDGSGMTELSAETGIRQ